MPDSKPKLYAGEQLDLVAGFPTLYTFFPADPRKPLIVFIPGNGHNARISYGGHQGYSQKDFLAYWLNRHGHGLLAISYPLESEPEIMPPTAPHFRIRDWGRQAAEVTQKVIERHKLCSQVVLAVWSMAGKIIIPYAVVAKSLGIDVTLFVSLAATPGIHGTRPPPQGIDNTAAGYATAPSMFSSFLRQMEEQSKRSAKGESIIPDDIYIREYCGFAPVSLAAWKHRYDRDTQSFIQDDWTSTEDAAVDQVQHCPMIVALTGTSPLDARHVITDQATWSFMLTRKLMHMIDARDPRKIAEIGNWDKLIDMVHSVPAHISYSIPGNHFFFLGEIGARKTAEVIVKHLEKAQRFRREFEELLTY